MPDMLTDGFNSLMNGKTAGVPNMFIILMVAGLAIFIYLYATKKPKAKEFKPMDMKKETKRRFKREYKYFGQPLNKNVYQVNDEKPIAYAIGYMKVVEMKAMKRLEPIWTNFPKEMLKAKHDKTAMDIYERPYDQLNEVEKKNIDEVSKDELRQERMEDMPTNEQTRIVRGKKEVQYSQPVSMFMLKTCTSSLINKIFARYLGVGIDWMLFNSDQIDFGDGRLTVLANLQRRTPFDIFVFSKEGKSLVQDISYGIERENIWQETANQIPRAVHFDTEASKQLVYRREDAKIERDKHKAQTETHEFG